jgi:radical SAM protein with 4Fe4S-binding SPASM domain
VSTGEPRCQDQVVPGASPESYAVISRVQDWAYQNLIPLNASLEITLRCNIRCLHCYNFDRDEPREACGKPELSADEILKVMDDLRAAGCLFLMLTGGEILSHPELFRFLDHARTLNLAVHLLTNGTMLRPGVAARLAAYENLQGVSVSLYGATAEVHDGVTQMPGSFRRSWEGINRLRNLGVIVRVKFILMRQNAHETAAMQAQAEALALPYMVDLTITARHDRSEGSLETRLEPAQLEALYRGPLRALASSGAPKEATEESFPCNCARGNVAITATGDVLPCVSVPWAAGNVREQPFAEIWRSSPVFQRIRGLRIADYEQCAPCAHRDHCTRNRGAAFLASGSYTGVDPFVCTTAEIAHRLADERAAEPAARPAGLAGPAALAGQVGQAGLAADRPAVRARLAVVG